MSTNAWHLRQDGKAFPVKVHMYCMQDDDLSSEAEVASFIYSTKTKDEDRISSQVLEAWMSLGIYDTVSFDDTEDDIISKIKEFLSSLPYRFPYPTGESELINLHRELNNYHNIDEYYDYVDNLDIKNLQNRIKSIINQQFCRVRYGGQYDVQSNNNEVWFRISSVGYNWANTIYEFVTDIKNKYKISSISICRDNESDYSDIYDGTDYFYKAKDVPSYEHMPIEEFLREEHEHSMYFENKDINLNRGIMSTLRQMLNRGYNLEYTIRELSELYGEVINVDRYRSYLLRREKQMVL